jgi:glycosyltransferase involved in cell wall biosynthesis
MQFHGTLTEMPDFGSRPAEDFYASWDILLYLTTPKYTETWCRVVTESMASGLAIVAEKKGAIPEQIDHGVNGFLCETDDEFVECVNKFIDDPKLCTQMGLAAREKAKKEFSIPAFRRKTIDLFMQLMARLPVESEA